MPNAIGLHVLGFGFVVLGSYLWFSSTEVVGCGSDMAIACTPHPLGMLRVPTFLLADGGCLVSRIMCFCWSFVIVLVPLSIGDLGVRSFVDSCVELASSQGFRVVMGNSATKRVYTCMNCLSLRPPL